LASDFDVDAETGVFRSLFVMPRSASLLARRRSATPSEIARIWKDPSLPRRKSISSAKGLEDIDRQRGLRAPRLE